jgi:hypothetical protein
LGGPDKIELFKALGDNAFGLMETVPYPDDHAIALADLKGNGYDELIFNGGVDGDGTPIAIHIDELADIQPPSSRASANHAPRERLSSRSFSPAGVDWRRRRASRGSRASGWSRRAPTRPAQGGDVS